MGYDQRRLVLLLDVRFAFPNGRIRGKEPVRGTHFLRAKYGGGGGRHSRHVRTLDIAEAATQEGIL